ncbi:response regulator [Marinobacter sp.]|uniref:response regulator n=1 Tax=Marinobacter sp. TaxID=50741 RepID=UPI0035644D0E
MAEASPGQKLQELKIRYIAGLPDRMDELRDSWNRLQYVSWDPKALAFMSQCAHKLSGSGATFQFPDITNTSRVLEQHLLALLEKPDASAAERGQVDHALKALEQAIAQATTSESELVATEPKPVVEEKRQHRIAIIEDDTNQAEHLKNWLEQQGYSGEIFDNPYAYSQRTEGQQHHLILLDISFPKGALEGIAWLERMKSRIGTHTPVIMMSARSDMVARMRALRAGADLYLTKPIDMGVLEKRIQQLLKSPETTRPRVLWVDDDADLLTYYNIMLTNAGYEVETLSQPVRILEQIEKFQPDAIVLDHEMPGCQGAELAQLLRQDARYMTIPLLFVSAAPEARALLEQQSIGGNEFFSKPLDDKKFLKALHQHLTKAQLIATRINLVSQRRESLGLQNLDYFLAGLGDLLTTLTNKQQGQSYYLAQASIDRQDFLRAQHGARAMARLNTRMEKHFAQQLTAGNSGCALGDGSFLFLLSTPAGTDGQAFLEHFHTSLSTPDWVLEPSTPVTLSLGALTLNHSLDEDSALLEVEKACTEAMDKGGNRILWQQAPEPSPEVKVDNRIRELIEARSFKLHYQPIVNMETGDTLFEALVRLVDENNVVYLPGQFLDQLPEDNRNPFHDLDRWVIQHAVQDLAQLTGKASASHSVSVKLSSPMADIEPLLSLLSSTMRDARLKGKLRIYLALSGSGVIKDVAKAKKIRQLVQNMDCGLVIEHLDISPASVELIKELGAVDLVKLAPALGAHDKQTLALDQFLQQLKSTLNSSEKIVVTGVEDTKALTWFWERGIRNFQGYFIQEPNLAMNYEL